MTADTIREARRLEALVTGEELRQILGEDTETFRVALYDSVLYTRMATTAEGSRHAHLVALAAVWDVATHEQATVAEAAAAADGRELADLRARILRAESIFQNEHDSDLVARRMHEALTGTEATIDDV